MASVSLSNIMLQNNTDRTFYVTWDWQSENTDHYSVMWYYETGNGVWFEAGETTTKSKQSLYDAPSNALSIKVKVKPISKTHNVNNEQVSYWNAEWSTEKHYTLKVDENNSLRPIPDKPPAPSVSITRYTLTADVNYYSKASDIEFEVVADDRNVIARNAILLRTMHAAYSVSIAAGRKYKVRCRANNQRYNTHSEWSEYSSNVETIPTAPRKITKCCASSETSVRLEWKSVTTATSYEIQYTTKMEYFDTSSSVQSMTVESVSTRAEVTGLDSGEEWFFRVRAVNDVGHSSWTSIASTVLGTIPSNPTTWSKNSTVIVGEKATLYWVHNSKDGSSQTGAQLELIINGVRTVKTITSDKDDDEINEYHVDTKEYLEGTSITWRVRTKGILSSYGKWSVQRTINVYAPPTLVIGISNSIKWYWDTFNFIEDTIYTAYGPIGEEISVLKMFPLVISAEAYPETQTPVSYHLSIVSNQSYTTVDNLGNEKLINKDAEIYSKSFDTSNSHLVTRLYPGDINIDNNMSYTIKITVTMNSGLTAEASTVFTVGWQDETYAVNAELGINSDSVSAVICPYCEDENGELAEHVYLSVYRREYDGKFTEIATDIPNDRETFVTDPHPALDYARYRIVAISKVTGGVNYYDMPAYPIKEQSTIIQWDEEWTSFNGVNAEQQETPNWSGSLLKLPYNISISNEHSTDVSLIKYAGREHPVSYYGTQLGETSSWSVAIDKDDVETLFAIRRLAVYKGDVYVREPSGSGYWASISVSYNTKYDDLTIPITLQINRVDGGI